MSFDWIEMYENTAHSNTVKKLNLINWKGKMKPKNEREIKNQNECQNVKIFISALDDIQNILQIL